MAANGLLGAIQAGKSLKKVETRESTVNLKEMDAKDVNKYQQTVQLANVENWIDLIKDVTFPTQFCPISEKAADLFIDCYKDVEKRKSQQQTQQQQNPSKNNNSITIDQEIDQFPLSENLKKELEKFQVDLQSLMSKVQGTDDCVFVKTSSRSAKDTGPNYLNTFTRIYQDFASRMPKPTSTDSETDFKIMCLLLAGTEMLKMRSAKQVLYTFAISERIYQDMLLAKAVVANPEENKHWNENFIVRKWIEVDPALEFRVFVRDNRENRKAPFQHHITGISQYNHLCFWPVVNERKNEWSDRIVKFWETRIKDRLTQFPEYVIDFVFTGAQHEDIWVIELNPFLPTTDGCMYQWGDRILDKNGIVTKETYDSHEMHNGPLKIRAQHAIRKGSESLLSMDWRDIVKTTPVNWQSHEKLKDSKFVQHLKELSDAYKSGKKLELSESEKHDMIFFFGRWGIW